MTKEEKQVLKTVVVDHSRGLFSPAELINGIAKRDRRLVEHLVAKGFLEEVPQDQPGTFPHSTHTTNFYRATAKGILIFSPWHERFWSFIQGDVRTVIVSVITAAVTAVVTLVITHILSK